MTCVQRLKKTWKLLPKKQQAIWRKLSTAFSASRNYLTYRKEILGKLESHAKQSPDAHANDPNYWFGGIPFMGIHLSDLIYIEETYGKDKMPDGKINFAKMRYASDECDF